MSDSADLSEFLQMCPTLSRLFGKIGLFVPEMFCDHNNNYVRPTSAKFACLNEYFYLLCTVQPNNHAPSVLYCDNMPSILSEFGNINSSIFFAVEILESLRNRANIICSTSMAFYTNRRIRNCRNNLLQRRSTIKHVN